MEQRFDHSGDLRVVPALHLLLAEPLRL